MEDIYYSWFWVGVSNELLQTIVYRLLVTVVVELNQLVIPCLAILMSSIVSFLTLISYPAVLHVYIPG